MESTSHRSVGRPSEQIQSRERLIISARELFTVMAYNKVSTRLIARRAGVNIAMIRYYFGSKAGLFEAMLRETLHPLKQQMNKLLAKSNQKNLVDLMRVYYKEMIKVPQFPKLLAQVMSMPPGEIQRDLMEEVMQDLSQPIRELLSSRLVNQGVIRPDMDPYLCRMSYISLMVFPFLIPASMLSIYKFELTDDFLERLIEHNIRLMEGGFLVPEGANISV
ncbi:putative HTH-type transcriptional regulator YttP [Vibrio aerogenes CECT 7868]|uniref:Putative HTH-type transcriptional regulator YttP n=1 Tax=Vibrio aerogenes CECT 7868 TaxID=1216006 RepID=A0A1M5UQ92_9VIBR|nr:TetR/AcrR family transcriptional regulator [Vibrio aerogenes]SHH65242.1 putative HTH-type transcriptional regulator YttP [Vibrio aerogenes CECT 7868]